MNLAWVAIIAGFVLLEKVLPAGQGMGRLTGAALMGTWLIITPLV
jgi:predicted metal-binding membrane protein